jgi:hypothetical protein
LCLPSLPASAQTGAAGTVSYRGFTVDMTGAAAAPNGPAIETSLKHQIDITADCGASAAAMAFFKSPEILSCPGRAFARPSKLHLLRLDRGRVRRADEASAVQRAPL